MSLRIPHTMTQEEQSNEAIDGDVCYLAFSEVSLASRKMFKGVW